MARALMGHIGSSTEHVLASEVHRLRRRVAELEAELDSVREHAADSIEIELHHFTEAGQPVPA